jgi:hypothetical protein
VIYATGRPSVGVVEIFIVERYLPGTSDRQLREATDLLAAATRDVAAGGTPITFLGSTFVAAEEYCFCRFESGSAADVERVCELAGVLYARIVAGRDLDPSTTAASPPREGNES